MKRLAIFSLLLAAALMLTGWTATDLKSAATEVELREEPLFGDSSAAEGLRVLTHAELRNDTAGWDTVVSFGEDGPEISAGFHWGADADSSYWDLLGDSFSMDFLQTVYNTYSLGGGPDYRAGGAVYTSGGYRAATNHIRDVMARTENGQMRREVVALGDYYDARLWDLEVRYGYYSAYEFTMADSTAMARVFRVPYPEDLLVEVTVQKSPNGRDTMVTSAPAPEYHEPEVEAIDAVDTSGYIDRDRSWDNVTAQVPGDVGKLGVWLYPTALDGEGNNLVEYRDGPGVYFIPRRDGDRDSAMWRELNLNRIALFYPTDARPIDLCLSSDETVVLLVTASDGEWTLTALDAETGREVGRYDLFASGEDRMLLKLERGGMLLGGDGEGNVFVAEAGEGSLSRVFTTKLTDLGLDGGGLADFSDGQSSFAFDGDRLALANADSGEVLVADASGLLYAARIDQSILWNGRDPAWSIIGYGGSAQAAYGSACPVELSFE